MAFDTNGGNMHTINEAINANGRDACGARPRGDEILKTDRPERRRDGSCDKRTR